MATNGAPSLYDLLGVAPDASQPELTRAYRRRARELHPDLAAAGSGDESFAALTRAYRLLSDPARRAAYDATHQAAGPSGRTTRRGDRAVAVPIRRVASAAPSASPGRIRRPLDGWDRQPPIAAGPTYVHPNDDAEATR